MTAEGACEVSKEKMEGEDSMEESADEQPRREREVCGEGGRVGGRPYISWGSLGL